MESSKDNAQWRDKLSPDEYRICRQKGTERPFTGEFWDNKQQGMYTCKCCGAKLFDASAKYDSGSGWPSFYRAVQPDVIVENRDASLAMERVEIVCSHCDCHLGHVFPDGPPPTGLRYCVNSASMNFVATEGIPSSED